MVDEVPQYNIFRGASPYQRGYGGGYGGIQGGAGIGAIFRGLYRFFLPIIRRVGDTVGAEVIQTGQRVVNKVINEHAPVKQTLISEGKRGVDNVLERGGLARQFGTGGGQRRYKRGAKRQRDSIYSHQTLIGKAVNPALIRSRKRKQQRTDAFGLY